MLHKRHINTIRSFLLVNHLLLMKQCFRFLSERSYLYSRQVVQDLNLNNIVFISFKLENELIWQSIYVQCYFSSSRSHGYISLTVMYISLLLISNFLYSFSIPFSFFLAFNKPLFLQIWRKWVEEVESLQKVSKMYTLF